MSPLYYTPKTLNKATLEEVRDVLEKLNEKLDNSYSIFIQFRTWGNEKERQSDLLILTKNGIYNLEVKFYKEVKSISYPGDWVVTDGRRVANPLRQSEDTADNIQRFLQKKAEEIFGSGSRRCRLFRDYVKVFPLLLLKNPLRNIPNLSSRCKLLNGLDDLVEYFGSKRDTWYIPINNPQDKLELKRDDVEKIARLYNLIKIENIQELFQEQNTFVQELHAGVKQVYDYTRPVSKEKFFNRDDELRNIKKIISNKQNFLVIGEKLVGKTSLAKQIEYMCKEEKLAIPFYINFAALRYDDEKSLLLSFLSWIVEKINESYGGDFYQSINLIYNQFENMEPKVAGCVFLQVMKNIYDTLISMNLIDRQILFLFDSFDKLRSFNNDEFINYFIQSFVELYNNYVSSIDKGVIFGIFMTQVDSYRDYEKAILQKVPVENRTQLSNFTIDTVRRFLDETGRASGVSFSDEATNEIYKITNGHPYYLQCLCYSIVDILYECSSNIVTKEIVEQAKSKINLQE
ncbi:MAG: ATP-binding protein [Elusimicrobiota bacterium]|nr:NERD domain-containing protein [Endomicrobiia bacterium]MDW8166414.1 ATP-binding protein [Elusimicrobiota bacterium]